jgi:hypothetical protein
MALLLLFGFAGDTTAQAADIQRGPVASVGPGSQFAIADFDGDFRPDLANIQSGTNIFGSDNYWIQLQLSSAGRQSIQLVAPAGGLLIEARDVNGDHAVDLVLSTVWFRQPVAIFLNDGHGRFSRADPTASPGAFSESETNWGSRSNLATDSVGMTQQSGAGICSKEKDSLHDRSPAGLIPPPSAGFSVSPFLVSQPGRAPPYEIPCL